MSLNIAGIMKGSRVMKNLFHKVIPAWGAVVFTVFPTFALAQQGYGERGYGGHMMNWGFGGGFLGGLPMIILWIAIIIGLVFLVRWAWRSKPGEMAGPSKQDALEILKSRYAKGELTREQFRAMKDDLTS